MKLHKMKDLPPGILLSSSMRGRMAPPQSDHCKTKNSEGRVGIWSGHWEHWVELGPCSHFFGFALHREALEFGM